MPDRTHIVPRLVPAIALSLAVVSSIVAGEIPISEPLLHPASGEQRSPSVAGNGTDFFAAWADARSRLYDPSVQPSPRAEWDIYGSRLGLDGSADPAGGTAISASAETDDAPAVVWNGSEYVVIDAAWPWWGPGRITFTRVGDRGPAAPVDVALSGDAAVGYGTRLAAAWNGSEYLVVLGYSWPAQPSVPLTRPNVVRAMIVDRDFHLVRAFVDVSDGADSILPAVSSDGSSFLITWISPGESEVRVRSAVVSPAGEVTRSADPLGVTPLATSYWPARSAWNGQRYLVSWSDGMSIHGRLLDRAASPVAEDFTIARTEGIGVFAPAVAWNGSMFLVSFAYRNEWPAPDPKTGAVGYPVTNVYATRVRADGSLIDQPWPLTITTAPGDQTVSDVAASGDRFIVAWEDGGNIRSATVDAASGAVTADSLLTRSIRVQSNGSGVFDGQNFGFLWTEESDVMFGRVSIDGRTLDGPGRTIASGTSKALVWNGSEYLAVWEGPGGATRAIRLSPNGDALDATPIELPEGGHYFASDGVDFLVITGNPSFFLNWGSRTWVASYRVTAGGEVTKSQIIAPAEFAQWPIGLAWDGSNYVLGYVQYGGEVCYKCFPPSEYRAVKLDRGGRAAGSPLHVAASGPVAAGNGHAIVAGAMGVPEGGRYQLVLTLIDGGSQVVALQAFASMTAPFRLAAAWDGKAFVIAFGDSIYTVSTGGALLDVQKQVMRSDALTVALVPARGATPLLVRRIEVLPPWHHAGGIERYFLEWPDAPRRRSTAHR